MKKITNTLKTWFIAGLYNLAFVIFPFAVYSRQPFVRYPYMYRPSHLISLAGLMLRAMTATKCGAVVEVGCNQGWTSCFLLETLREEKIIRHYICLDTFTGFTNQDVEVEEIDRGKPPGIYADYFKVNAKKWLEASLRRFGYHNARAVQADCTTFEFARHIGQIAFCLVDVDLYRPVKVALKRIYPLLVPGGSIVVDDCDQDNALWDGSYQAYSEFCRDNGLTPEIVGGKLGVIRK